MLGNPVIVDVTTGASLCVTSTTETVAVAGSATYTVVAVALTAISETPPGGFNDEIRKF